MNSMTFADEVKAPVIDLPRAALLCARAIAYPALDVEHYLERLDQLATAAGNRLTSDDGLFSRAVAVSNFLFNDSCLTGNVSDYADPRNSYLNEVLDRKLGIPITLSVIYLAVAKRLGLPVCGVGLPGHFIVGVREGEETLLLDPFHGGRCLTRADCARLMEKTTGYSGPFHSGWLEPVTPAQILVRMLNNLRLIYVNSESWVQARTVIEHLRLLQPDAPGHLRDIGLIGYQMGDMRQAALYLEKYLEQAPESPDAVAIRHHFQTALNSWVQAN
jgi:regulator of sirC expression with transglutaminase-like and TPR domain